MDNLTNEQLAAQALAAAQGQVIANDGSKLLIDRMHDLFDADDLVKIKNFTDRKIVWVYCDKKTTRIEQPNEFTRRVWQGEQKARVLEPGKSVVIPGWEAYVALSRFYEDWAIKDENDERGAHVLSGTMQQEFLGKAYLGIYDVNSIEEEPVDVKKEVEDDLGLSDGKETKQSATTSKK